MKKILHKSFPLQLKAQGDDRTIEQIVKQCERLARVREVKDITTRPHIELFRRL